ncbi:MarR family winged helix-turn-helix transcriptional regulator [Chloroflexota bacterium]
MKRKLASPIEIEKVASKIKLKEFTHIASFADITNRYIDLLMKKSNDNRLHWGVLSYLVLRRGRLRPTDLARLMFRSKHNMTQVIDDLEKQGLVIRQRTRKDRRDINIRITDAGLGEFTGSLERGNKAWEPVIDSLTKDEKEIFLELIGKVRLMMINRITEKLANKV